MGTLAGTRLSMCMKPQQTAEMNTPHCSNRKSKGPSTYDVRTGREEGGTKKEDEVRQVA